MNLNGKKDIGHLVYLNHSESFSQDPKAKELVEFIGQRSYEFLDWQGFDLRKSQLTLYRILGTRV